MQKRMMHEQALRSGGIKHHAARGDVPRREAAAIERSFPFVQQTHELLSCPFQSLVAARVERLNPAKVFSSQSIAILREDIEPSL